MPRTHKSDKSFQINVVLPPEIKRALERYIEQSEPRVSITAVVAAALGRFLSDATKRRPLTRS